MRLILAAVGRLKTGPERELVARYAERIAATGKAVGLTGLTLKETDESRAKRPEDRKSEEARALRALIPDGARIVALDERGTPLTTKALAERLRHWQQDGDDVALLIGGPDGLSPELRTAAHERIRLSDLTLPHAMARVLLVESLYRAWSVNAGHPYHRE